MAASLEDEIATLNAQIAEHENIIMEHSSAILALQQRLSKIAEVPAYITDCIDCLVGLLGRNEKWEKKITEVMTARLQSKPVYDDWDEAVKEYVNVRINNAEYNWNGKTIDYYTVFVIGEGSDITPTFDDYEIYAGSPKDKRAVKVHKRCTDILIDKSWDALESFKLKYIPILVGYIDGGFPSGDRYY